MTPGTHPFRRLPRVQRHAHHLHLPGNAPGDVLSFPGDESNLYPRVPIVLPMTY